MTIEISKEIALDLIYSRIRELDSQIEEILKKYNESTIEDFIQAVKTGIIIEAEDYAIDIENLRDKRNEIKNLIP
ncbi:MAG: hypothetical protein INQ03_21925 [Candidatus Heimdallarchaeota archaeon]|nr:hypothetical protein [Candidatus Heimdallarchaeota archaeon]